MSSHIIQETYSYQAKVIIQMLVQGDISAKRSVSHTARVCQTAIIKTQNAFTHIMNKYSRKKNAFLKMAFHKSVITHSSVLRALK